MNYYNENCKKTAAWLSELIRQRHLPEGVVDTRSICEVQPEDLRGFTQCHFFAGIGGWSLALRIAGIPSDTKLWTGSCPCQPFSNGGEGRGFEDERHLWPEWLRLICEAKPAIVLGEQVESKLAYEWLEGVFSDMEVEGYGCAGASLNAAGVGAPQLRQRLYWLAHAPEPGMEKLVCLREGAAPQEAEEGETAPLDARMGLEEWMELRKGLGEPGLFPSSDGLSQVPLRLRGYGNAVVPQLAAKFLQASLEAIDLMHSVSAEPSRTRRPRRQPPKIPWT